ncbi:Heme oxygenase-like protein [Elsinoe fawcettii]|nr:Heme oxygenase-like protein [Elsinoe fawcettii]
MVSADLPDGPARLLSPPPPATKETLPFRINAATRQIHTSLNKLVTARLALAIPPYTSDPILYLHGIHTFAQLYFTFEDSWQDLICAHLSASSPFVPPQTSLPSPPDSPPTTPSLHNDKLRTFLATLVPPTLWRTQRLEKDILYLSQRFSVALPNANADPLFAELQAHIATTTAEKPHVLLAYSWVLYMAIFSGGRWIRAQLQNAGPEFWGHETSPATTQSREEEQAQDPAQKEQVRAMIEQGISLFHFDGPDDGEDIKRFFKEKFLSADDLLSEEEKEEVVQEADWIFHACVRLVEELDERLETAVETTDQGKTATREEGGKKTAERGTVAVDARKWFPQSDTDIKFPGPWVSKGLDPFAAMLAVALGLGGWYLLHSFGVVGRALLSNF